MKHLPEILVTFILVVGLLGLYVKNASALEQTINVDGVNYVSLQQMGKKYNMAVADANGSINLTGEAVNLTVPTSNNIFTLNGNSYIAQFPPKVKDGQTWITAKDWASMFDLSLTHYDKVSQMQPVDSEPVSTEVILDENTYTVSEEWGDQVPEGVRKHGSPEKVFTPHIELPIYNSTKFNEETQGKTQGR